MFLTLDTDTLAQTMGTGFAVASLAGGEVARTEFYNEVYLPLLIAMQVTNFPEHPFGYSDTLKFSSDAARAEQAYISDALECGRSTVHTAAYHECVEAETGKSCQHPACLASEVE